MSKKLKHSKRVDDKKPAEQLRLIPSGMTWAARGCLLGASGIAAYLLWYAITKKPLAGCGPGSPCDRVMGSSWAYWLGIPVSAPALVAYATLLISSFVTTGGRRAAGIMKAWRVLLGAGVAVMASAIWFTILQLFVLKSICKYCTSAHVLGFAGVILLFCETPFFSSPQRKLADLNKFARRLAVVPVLLGLLSFAILAGGQKLFPRKINSVGIHQGAFNFDLDEVPLIGSRNAPRFIVTLFDYTCPDCQEMHRQLVAARERLNNTFSVVALPLPLDPRCNSLIRSANPKHAQACDYARIGLALRLAGLEPFQKYDQWYFGLSATPSLAKAREHAIELIGQPALDKNSADPWIEKMLQTSVSIYTKNGKITHSYRLPQLIVGDVVLTGPVRNLDELLKFLNTNLSKTPL